MRTSAASFPSEIKIAQLHRGSIESFSNKLSVVKPDPKCSQPTIEASARDDVLKKKPIKTRSETTRESVSNQVAIGLSFASD